MQIGMIGLAGSGKDTAALILQRVLAEQGMQFEIDRYAAPLKRATKMIFGSTFDDRDVKEVEVKVDQDLVIESTFKVLHALNLTEAEMDKASDLFFDHIGFLEYLSPRKYQLLLGTEVGRAIKPTIWTDRLRKDNTHNIITDVRFPNEVCFSNLLLERFENLDRPKHKSEHLAWDLQFTGLRLPVDVIQIDNRDHTTLEELEHTIRQKVSLLTFKEVI